MWPFDPDGFDSRLAPPEGTSDDAWYFVFLGGKLLSAANQSGPGPIDGDAFRWLGVETLSQHYLGELGLHSCYAVDAAGEVPEGYSAGDLYGWLGRVESPMFYLAGRAHQIVEWHNSHRFCGVCGAATRDHAADRAKQCTSCGHIVYPRLSPSIIVLIRRGDEALMARNANWPEGFYSTLAGFVEPGESVEQTLHREVAEEVGVRVTNLRYMGSQSWPFPNSLMLGYHADYLDGEIVCQDGEIADAQWFRHDDMPNVPPKAAISRWLIDAWLDDVGGG